MQVDGELHIAEDEAEVIRTIYDKFTNTTMGIAAIATFLNNRGYPDHAITWFKDTEEGNRIYNEMTFYRKMEMCKVSQRKAEERGLSLSIYPANMTKFNSGRTYSLAIIARSGFMHLPTPELQRNLKHMMMTKI